jgi:hypothetical protein
MALIFRGGAAKRKGETTKAKRQIYRKKPGFLIPKIIGKKHKKSAL